MELVNYFVEDFNQWILKPLSLPDPRTENWFLISSGTPVICVLLMYLFFAYYLGPKFMENRKPFNMKTFTIFINTCHLLLTAFLFKESVAIWSEYNWICQNVVYTDDDITNRAVFTCYLFFFAKCLEMVDTVIFVLRKSYRQLTFLHLYHHVLMVITSWGLVRYHPGGHSTFMILLNMFVHIFMYSHYLLSAYKPNYPGVFKFKKAITEMQLIQFIAIAIHTSFLFFVSCGYPTGYAFWEIPHDLALLYLFVKFYKGAYNKKSL